MDKIEKENTFQIKIDDTISVKAANLYKIQIGNIINEGKKDVGYHFKKLKAFCSKMPVEATVLIELIKEGKKENPPFKSFFFNSKVTTILRDLNINLQSLSCYNSDFCNSLVQQFEEKLGYTFSKEQFDIIAGLREYIECQISLLVRKLEERKIDTTRSHYSFRDNRESVALNEKEDVFVHVRQLSFICSKYIDKRILRELFILIIKNKERGGEASDEYYKMFERIIVNENLNKKHLIDFLLSNDNSSKRIRLKEIIIKSRRLNVGHIVKIVHPDFILLWRVFFSNYNMTPEFKYRFVTTLKNMPLTIDDKRKIKCYVENVNTSDMLEKKKEIVLLLQKDFS